MRWFAQEAQSQIRDVDLIHGGPFQTKGCPLYTLGSITLTFEEEDGEYICWKRVRDCSSTALARPYLLCS